MAANYGSLEYLDFDWFYRDKDDDYFNEVWEDGTMEGVLKDENGDPYSPINGRLEGLYFSVNVNFRTGLPMEPSIFGDRRLEVPAGYMFDLCPRLYFTDFYCLSKKSKHRVTLVMTSPGSRADRFCKKHLPRLDITDNPFLTYDSCQGEVLSNGIYTEVFFTEDIDLSDAEDHGAQMSDVDMRVYSDGYVDAKEKWKGCAHCNI